jgi:hypothetical protein
MAPTRMTVKVWVHVPCPSQRTPPSSAHAVPCAAFVVPGVPLPQTPGPPPAPLDEDVVVAPLDVEAAPPAPVEEDVVVPVEEELELVDEELELEPVEEPEPPVPPEDVEVEAAPPPPVPPVPEAVVPGSEPPNPPLPPEPVGLPDDDEGKPNDGLDPPAQAAALQHNVTIRQEESERRAVFMSPFDHPENTQCARTLVRPGPRVNRGCVSRRRRIGVA